MTIEELKQALEAATPGPWEILDGNEIYTAPVKTMNYQRREMIADAWGADGLDQANAHLIVAAVNNLPALLKVAEAAQNAVDGTRSCLGADLKALRKALEELNND